MRWCIFLTATFAWILNHASQAQTEPVISGLELLDVFDIRYRFERYEETADDIRAIAIGPDGCLYSAYSELPCYIVKDDRKGSREIFAENLYLTSGPNATAPTVMAFDKAGNLYLAESNSYSDSNIIRITPSGDKEHVATVPIYEPGGLAINRDGDIFISDFWDGKNIYKVQRNGDISIFSQSLEHVTSLIYDFNQELLYSAESYQDDPLGNGYIFAIDAEGKREKLHTLPEIFRYMLKDANGNFIGCTNMNKRVYMVDEGGDITTIPHEVEPANGLTMDPVGNLFLAGSQNTNGGIYKLKRSLLCPENWNSLTELCRFLSDFLSGNSGARLTTPVYSLTAGNEVGGFSIEEGNGKLHIADPSKLDYETVPNYTLRIELSDGASHFYEDLDIALVDQKIAGVQTLRFVEISADGARVKASVYADEGFIVHERGIVIGTEPLPTLDNQKITAGSGLGAYEVPISGLALETDYYVRAYAINAEGVAYGEELKFTTTATPLPVELIHFKGALEEETVHLQWATASESFNEYFIIERSKDGINFQRLATVAGMGTTYKRTDYSYHDYFPLPENSYYRLLQVDSDASITAYEPIFIKGNLAQLAFRVFPNPVKGGELMVWLSSTYLNSTVSCELLDTFGRRLWKKSNIKPQNGFLYLSLPSNIPNGGYMLLLKGYELSYNQLIVISR